MGRELSHEEAGDLLGAFALDSVEGEEAEAVERHVLGCPRCRAEVAGYREVAALLANDGSPAPEGLWDRISGGLDTQPPDLDLDRVAPIPLTRARGRPRRPSVSVRLAAAVGAVAAALVALLGLKIVDQQQRVRELDAALQVRGLERALDQALANPRSQRVTMAAGGASGGEARAQVVVLPDGRGFVFDSTLPPLTSDRTYQLWGVAEGADGRKVSLGLLGDEPTIEPFTLAPGVSVLAVTAEQDPGAVQPEGQVVAAARVRA